MFLNFILQRTNPLDNWMSIAETTKWTNNLWNIFEVLLFFFFLSELITLKKSCKYFWRDSNKRINLFPDLWHSINSWWCGTIFFFFYWQIRRGAKAIILLCLPTRLLTTKYGLETSFVPPAVLGYCSDDFISTLSCSPLQLELPRLPKSKFSW